MENSVNLLNMRNLLLQNFPKLKSAMIYGMAQEEVVIKT